MCEILDFLPKKLYNDTKAGFPAEKEDQTMVTVTTFSELADAVRSDEAVIRMEGEAKSFYEKRTNDTLGGGVVGAVPGLLLGGPIGAIVGAAVGAAIGASQGGTVRYSERDIQRFLMLYYRRTSSGVTYIEVTHR